MPRPQIGKAKFIRSVQELFPECNDPLALKRKLEQDIGHMGYAETLLFLQSYEQTGDQLTSLRQQFPADRGAGHDTSNPTLLHGLIEGRGNRKTSSRHRPTEEITERHIRQGKERE